MQKLDDMDYIEKLDSGGMLRVEEEFPLQLADAQKIAQAVDLSKISGKKYAGIAFLGMGGSGFAGDMIKALIRDEINIFIDSVKGYRLPGYVTKDWLVVPVSYSGNTEETIACTEQAVNKGATVMAVTSGGRLAQLAEQHDSAIIKVPSGYQPRGAIGYLFLPALVALRKLDMAAVGDSDIQEGLDAVRQLSARLNRRVQTSKNFAKQLACSIGERLPVIYGTEGYLSCIAYRWKCEINENAKTPCFWAQFPELNHNETVGWERLAPVTKNFVLIVLREQDEHQKIKVRIDTTVSLIARNLGQVIEVPVEGKSRFCRAISSLYIGDITSVYLALLSGVDPTPVEKIEKLKAELAKLD
ncbi:MAG: bifunctional phosphoglucose/phosphomannose isomerase [Actinomycetota bacterium]